MAYFASFLGVPQPLAPAVGDTGGGAPDEDFVDAFTLRCQLETNWCWAAVTEALERHRQRIASQSNIATDHIATHRPDQTCTVVDPTVVSGAPCNDNGCSAPCNGFHSLRRILVERALLRTDGFIDGKITYDQIKAEIRAGRPVACRIGWHGEPGMGHFVTIYGFSDGGAGNRQVHVLDPLFPAIRDPSADRRTMLFEEFLSGYRLGDSVGSQSHAYLVA